MILIDGYTLLFARGVMRNVDAARERLIDAVEAYCVRTGQRARIYFDSRIGPVRGRRANVEILFVAAGETADAAITSALAATDDRTAFHVISSDREIAEAARKRHAAVTASTDFLRELAKPAGAGGEPRAKTEGISDGEAEYWLREFGIDEEGDASR